MSKVTPIVQRKSDHIEISLTKDVDSVLSTGLEQIHFEHHALPNCDLKEIDLSLAFLDHPLDAPLLISSMTGGTEQAGKINLILAEAAQAKGIAMGLGSQRAAIENPSLMDTFQVRKYAPDILLFANLSAVQLNYDFHLADYHRAVEGVEADALVLHLNPIQEAFQPEGETNFSNLLPKIEALCQSFSIPVLAKEVGWGISAHVADMLIQAGIAGIDVAGAGGTSWSQVEMYRVKEEQKSKLAASFADWGIPTAIAIKQVRSALPHIPLIASGGLRSGIDLAKCIALGAELGGLASPCVKAASTSSDAVHEMIDFILMELRICMFVTGSSDLNQLRKARLLS